jgi:hypothetical protein
LRAINLNNDTATSPAVTTNGEMMSSQASLHMPDFGLNGGAASKLAFDDAEDAAVLQR